MGHQIPSSSAQSWTHFNDSSAVVEFDDHLRILFAEPSLNSEFHRVSILSFSLHALLFFQ